MKVFFDGLFGSNSAGLHKALDLTWKRNQAIASNIANAETPGYRAVDLDFAGELKKAFNKPQGSSLVTTNPLHMDTSGSGTAHFMPDYSGATKPDGNNVDIDIQMGQLAFNKSRYTLAATMMRRTMGFLSNVIRQAQ